MRNRILLVDDHDGLRELFAVALGIRGFECVAVASGEDALGELESGHFDLVILDLRMAGMSGLEVLKSMRAGNDMTRAMMVSASFSGEVVLEAAAMGVTVFLAKPVSLSGFHRSVQWVLEAGKDRGESADTVVRAAMLRDFRLAGQLLRERSSRTPEQEFWLGVYDELAGGGRPWRQEQLVDRAEAMVKCLV